MSQRLIISVHASGMVAVAATLSASTLKVTGLVARPLPDDVSIDDGPAVGAWLKGVLADAGLRGRRVIFGEDRHVSVLKGLQFDEGGDAADMPGMVRLQMIRQLSFPADDAVIDFVEQGTRGEDGSVRVQAAALPMSRVTWYEQIARAAGLKMHRVGLRTSGVGAIARGCVDHSDEATLVLAPAASACELLIMEGGRVVFSRSTKLLSGSTDDDDIELVARRVATEARRTWMSHRMGSDATPVDGVLVLGGGEMAEAIATRCGEDLGLPSKVITGPAVSDIAWEVDSAGSGEHEAEMLALAGLGLEEARGADLIDFAHPRQAPDRQAAVRQKALIGLLAAIVVIGGFFTWRVKQVEDLRSKQTLMSGHLRDLQETSQEILRDRVRVEHMTRWDDGDVDWLAHIDAVMDATPGNDRALIDSISCRGESGVGYDSSARRKPYDDEHWRTSLEVYVTIEGRAVDRQTANEIREALVRDDRYRATSVGDDASTRRGDAYPESFGLSLFTTESAPQTDSRHMKQLQT